MPCIPSVRDITILYPVGTATMDTRRTLENERRDKLILLETVLQSRSLRQLSNVNGTSWLRGVVKSIDPTVYISEAPCAQLDPHICNKAYKDVVDFDEDLAQL